MTQVETSNAEPTVDGMEEQIASGFQTTLTTGLGALCGALIAAPLLSVMKPETSTIVPLLALATFSALGALNGYRWRKSRGFIYFASVVALVLSGLLMLEGFDFPA